MTKWSRCSARCCPRSSAGANNVRPPLTAPRRALGDAVSGRSGRAGRSALGGVSAPGCVLPRAASCPGYDLPRAASRSGWRPALGGVRSPGDDPLDKPLRTAHFWRYATLRDATNRSAGMVHSTRGPSAKARELVTPSGTYQQKPGNWSLRAGPIDKYTRMGRSGPAFRRIVVQNSGFVDVSQRLV